LGQGPKWHILNPIPREKPKAPTRERLPPEKVAFIPRHIMLRSAPPAVYVQRQAVFVHGRPPPPGRLENSELAANSRKKEYSVSLPLCLAGFWLIKGGVPFWPGAKMAHS
jgi:hypothetical protein